MKTIRRLVLKWAKFMDKRRWDKRKGEKNRILNRGWGTIPYKERKFPNLKWWKGFIYKLCIKTILLINKIDPKGSWGNGEMFEYGKLADWEKDIIKKAREVR